MPRIDAHSGHFRDWDGLIGACNENPSLVPGHENLKSELAAMLEQARALKILQESLAGNRRAATDRFLDSLEQGKDGARKLRNFILSVLGSQSPFLPLFGIVPKPVSNPNNRRRRKKAGASTESPASPPAPKEETAPPATTKEAIHQR